MAKINLDMLRTGDFTEVIQSIKCGEQTDLACLCLPEVREAHNIIVDRFGLREQSAIFKQLCGCVIQQNVPVSAPPGGPPTIPASVPPVPVPPPVAQPAPPPAPPPPVQPGPGCDPALPPKGALTAIGVAR